MAIIKYKTIGFGINKIERVECVKETAASIWIIHKGYTSSTPHRSAKVSSYECYFDSWDEAKEHLMKIAQREIDSARKRLQNANDALGNIKGMKKPNE